MHCRNRLYRVSVVGLRMGFIAVLHLFSGQLDRSDRMNFTARTVVSLSLLIAMGCGVTAVTPPVLGCPKKMLTPEHDSAGLRSAELHRDR